MSKLMMSLLIGILLSSCASRKAGWETSSEDVYMSSTEVQKNLKKADALWAKREVKANLEESLKIYEQVAKGAKNKLPIYIKLAQGYYFFADAHIQDMEEKKKIWEKGTSFGELAMAQNQFFAKAMKEGKKVEDNLEYLSKEYTGAIYWTATNLGKWAKNSGIATILKYKTRIKKMIQKVQQLDASYFHHAADRYWGVYYAVAPSFAGGDVNKSIQHFDRSYKNSPSYLGTLVLKGEFYATKKGDQKLFTKLLKQVVSKKLNPKDPLYPDNKVQQNRAQFLLTQVDELF